MNQQVLIFPWQISRIGQRQKTSLSSPFGQGEHQGHGGATPWGIASNEEGHLLLSRWKDPWAKHGEF